MLPTLVYKNPGPHFGPNGMTYAYKGVKNEEELNEALAAGWRLELLPSEKKAEPSVKHEPTRDELIAMAEKLGIKVDKRWGDDRIKAELGKT